jgi:site-specific recombinase XerD
MCNLSELLKKSRIKLKDTSIKTYIVSLKLLKKQIGNDKEGCYNFLNDYEKVIKHLENNKITTQKNKLTAIIVFLKAINANDNLVKKYTDKLEELGKTYNDFLKTQEKTETQKNNWIEYEELVKLANKLMLEVKNNGYKNKTELNNKEFNLLKKLIIIKTYINYPIRNDFSDMKIIKKKDINKHDNNNNYLVIDGKNKEFHINSYKNKDRLGSKIYKIDNTLNRLINLWLKFNKSGYYLVQYDRKKPMTPNNITKFLNSIFKKEFNKKISTSMLRHITISHLLKNKPSIKEEEEKNKAIEDKFLHSKGINDIYRKID